MRLSLICNISSGIYFAKIDFHFKRDETMVWMDLNRLNKHDRMVDAKTVVDFTFKKAKQGLTKVCGHNPFGQHGVTNEWN